MKYLFYIVLFLSLRAGATTYYVSAAGDDNNSGTSQERPLKTIARLNVLFSKLKPGDKVLFKRGETFYGQLVAGKSGTTDNPITIGAYGAGENPVITGFALVSDWVSVGDGIWESAPFSSLNAVN